MPYVIAEPCTDSKDTSCWEVCPVDAIHPTPDAADFAGHDQLYIDPVGCIECGACVTVCPVGAIFADHDVPDEWAHYVERNRRHFLSPVPAGATAGGSS